MIKFPEEHVDVPEVVLGKQVFVTDSYVVSVGESVHAEKGDVRYLVTNRATGLVEAESTGLGFAIEYAKEFEQMLDNLDKEITSREARPFRPAFEH